jgi:hypothetical protein
MFNPIVSSRIFFLFPFFLGRKPRKTKLSDLNPLIDKAETTTEAPGIGITLNPLS